MKISSSIPLGDAGVGNTPRPSGTPSEREYAPTEFPSRAGWREAAGCVVAEGDRSVRLFPLQRAPRSDGEGFSVPVSPVHFARTIRESYGRFVNPPHRRFSAHA